VGAGLVLLLLQPDPAPLVLRTLEAGGRDSGTDEPAERIAAAYAYEPWNTDHLAALAQAYAAQRDYAGVLFTLENLAQERPLSPEEINLRGSAYAALGQLETAVEDWEAAWAAGGGDASALSELASIYMDRGEWDQASAALATLQTLTPTNAPVLYHLGLVRALVDPAAARSALELAAALDARYMSPTRTLIQALDARMGEARDVGYARLGVAYLGVGELLLAETALGHALTINPGYGEALAYYAFVQARLGKPALAASQQARVLAPESPIVHYLNGVVWLVYGRPVMARASLLEAAALDPENAAFAVEISHTYTAEDDLAQAEGWMLRAAEMAHDDPRFSILLAQFYIDEGYRVQERGLPLAQALVMRYPDRAEVFDALGWAYFLLGETTDAVMALDRALALDPDLARAHYHRARVYEAEGQASFALWHYQQAEALDPEGTFGALARGEIDRLAGSR